MVELVTLALEEILYYEEEQELPIETLQCEEGPHLLDIEHLLEAAQVEEEQ